MKAKQLRLWLACVVACIASMAVGVWWGAFRAAGNCPEPTLVAAADETAEPDPATEEPPLEQVETQLPVPQPPPEGWAEVQQQETPPAPASSHPAAAAPPSAQAMECMPPASTWTEALEAKLWKGFQELTVRWAKEARVRRGIRKEYNAYQRKIRDSDGSLETCNQISADLDNWLLQHSRPAAPAAKRLPGRPARPKPPLAPKQPPPPPPTPPPAAVAKAAPLPRLSPSRMPTQAVDCAMPANLWTDAMEAKLRKYTQQLTARWGDDAEAKKHIGHQYMEHQHKIRSSDGSAEVCEKISKGLDIWLRRHPTEG